jgi:ADP-heptose:LPS heptosyltransferase
MVYRPIIRNTVWSREQRHPDPDAYATLFQSIRDRFYVVSIADIHGGRETILKPWQEADLALHHGELTFKSMAGLFAQAALVFACPGFAPVLAQAVGTPVVVVYGGNESARTTQRVGTHLAPTLAIEPDRPCDCHDWNHACDKRITLPPALDTLEGFIRQCVISFSGRATSIRRTAPNCSIAG